MKRAKVRPQEPSQDILGDIEKMIGGVRPLPADSSPDAREREGNPETPAEESSPTLGDLGVSLPEPAGIAQGFLMSDEPFEERQPTDTMERALAEPVQKLGTAKYVQRIDVLEAFQYVGTLKDAPPWIDRNWTSYAGYDEVTKEEPGPALKVPGLGLCRKNWFIVQQAVRLDEAGTQDVRLAIYRPDDFYKWFLPLR
jgi:hypothetical protein